MEKYGPVAIDAIAFSAKDPSVWTSFLKGGFLVGIGSCLVEDLS